MRPRLSPPLLLLCCVLLPLVGRAQLATGVYRGNGYLPLVVTGLGFRPDVVLIKSDLSVGAALATSTLPRGTSKSMGDSGTLVTDGVQSLDDDGFTVVANSWRVNRADTTYAWVAFKASPEEVVVGSYVGDGTADRALQVTDWRPALVFLIPGNAALFHWRSEAMPEGTSFVATDAPLMRGRLLDFVADGFRVDDDVAVNAPGVDYHYVAFRGAEGLLEVGHYRGNGTADRLIGPAGPSEWVLLKANASTHALFRPRSLEGDATPYLFPLAFAPDRIAPLGPDGIRVSAHPEVNGVDVEHYWVAWSAGPRARLQPASQRAPTHSVFELDGSGSTPGGGARLVAWRWTQKEGPTGVALIDGPRQRLTLAHPGRYVFELTVTDSEGAHSPPARAELHVEGETYRPDPHLGGCAATRAGPLSPWLLLALLTGARAPTKKRERQRP